MVTVTGSARKVVLRLAFQGCCRAVCEVQVVGCSCMHVAGRHTQTSTHLCLNTQRNYVIYLCFLDRAYTYLVWVIWQQQAVTQNMLLFKMKNNKVHITDTGEPGEICSNEQHK